ncbi:MAG: hypothetical protein Q9222_005959 [Ikaeria aurantiellina]
MANVADSNPQHPEPTAQPHRGRSHSPKPLGELPWASLETSSIDPIFNGTSYSKRSNGVTLSARPSTSDKGRGGATHSREIDRRNSPSFHTPPRPQGSGHELRHDYAQSRHLNDPEKANHTRTSEHPGRHTGHTHSTYISEEEEDRKQHTVWILFHRFLAPPIRFQLGLVFSEYDSEFDGVMMKSEQYSESRGNPFMLVLINILSPLYAGGIAITAWIAAGFWLTAFILGNPDGRDGKDDGRAVVLGVRGLWERWLQRGLR